MNNLRSKEWWIAAFTRALKTVCQTAVALIGTGAIGILDVDWMQVASVAGLAGIVSILTSVAGLPEINYSNAINEIAFDSATAEGSDENGTANNE